MVAAISEGGAFCQRRRDPLSGIFAKLDGGSFSTCWAWCDGTRPATCWGSGVRPARHLGVSGSGVRPAGIYPES